MKARTALYFTAPRQVSLVEEEIPALSSGEVLVKTVLSAISPGTETMVYRGNFPEDLPIDATLPALAGKFSYPFKYGYASIGQVIASGEQVDPHWLGRLAFAFQPHNSHFIAAADQLLILPDGISPEDAIFLANMETAVSLVMDGAPLIGERVLVCGQGIVGLLTCALLASIPLASLVSLERFPLRRRVSLSLGVHACLDAAQPDFKGQLDEYLPQGADLSYELSGSPEALDPLIAHTGFGGRVVLGSWYGKQRASLDLGSAFHRSRIQLVSSQVSTIAPGLSSRWTKERRFEVAWEMIRRVRPAQFITHKIPFTHAEQAYRLLDEQPEETIQMIFTYP